jgi:hypothetical protein
MRNLCNGPLSAEFGQPPLTKLVHDNFLKKFSLLTVRRGFRPATFEIFFYGAGRKGWLRKEL